MAMIAASTSAFSLGACSTETIFKQPQKTYELSATTSQWGSYPIQFFSSSSLQAISDERDRIGEEDDNNHDHNRQILPNPHPIPCDRKVVRIS
jgi:hypothetical protein